MAPIALRKEVVCALLQCIRMLQPVPPDLFSSGLVQRLHFLDISPTNLDKYLCWPCPNQSRVIALFRTLTDCADDDPFLSVRYVSEGEEGDTFAHVCVGTYEPGAEMDTLRLIFQWEESDGWKYHDAGLMPFPVTATPSIRSAFTQAKSPPLGQLEITNGDPDQAYWDAYACGGDDGMDEQRLPTLLEMEKQAAQNEDAYWAQYASVQGTADSTRPSPVRARHEIHYTPHGFSPLHPPSSAEECLATSFVEQLDANSYTANTDTDKGTSIESASERPVFSISVALKSPPRSARRKSEPMPDALQKQREIDVEVSEHIQGAFRLWQSARGVGEAAREKEEFFRVVQRALSNE